MIRLTSLLIQIATPTKHTNPYNMYRVCLLHFVFNSAWSLHLKSYYRILQYLLIWSELAEVYVLHESIARVGLVNSSVVLDLVSSTFAVQTS